MSGITLSAGVRQNLLSLQNTASLMATTQNRLATGKKVNSALDNPSNFFTSQKLGDRASDLNSLLDSIGQATKTLDAANNGITSITQLVQSAKSIAQQARQSTGATNTYSTVDASSNILSANNLNGAESVATSTGTATTELKAAAINITGATATETLGQATGTGATSDATLGALHANAGVAAGNIVVTVASRNGTAATFTVALTGQKTQAAVKTAFDGTTATVNGTPGVALSSLVNVAYDATDHLQLTAKNAEVAFTIQNTAGGSTAATATDIGLTGAEYGGAVTSSSLFDQITTAGGSSAEGKTMSIAYTNADGSSGSQSITFGTGAGEVATLQDMQTAISSAASGSSGGFSATATATASYTFANHTVTAAINIQKAAASKASVAISGGAGVAGVVDSTNLLFKTSNSQATLKDLDSTNLAAGGSLSISVNGSNFTVGLSSTDRIDDVVSKLSSSALAANLTFTKNVASNGNENIKIDAKDSSVNYTVNANDTSAALKLTTNNATSLVKSSTSLLNLLNQGFGGSVTATSNAQGKTLTVAAGGGSTQTVTFGTGTNQIQTIAQLNTALGALSGVTGSVSDTGALDINVASGTSPTSLTVGGTATTKLGLTAATQTGTVISTTSNATRTSLQSDFNNVLDQIDALSKDASYNGINLLNGDDLKVSFNENGSSSLTIKGVRFDSSNLGMSKANGTQFQDNTQIDSTVTSIDNALTNLRTQSSKFGANLTTVQTRQDFTKNMINTLQTGADNLVLADTNEEGANMLALQTRQQLSTTALSMANQANQAVLRLF